MRAASAPTSAQRHRIRLWSPRTSLLSTSKTWSTRCCSAPTAVGSVLRVMHGSHREQATSLSTTTFFGQKIIVFLKRPFHQPRTDVQVPMQISIATYQDGEIAATMVNGYIQYIVMHSTRGGNVPDAGNPKSTSNKDQGGHYFGCEAMWPESNRSPTGCIVDCMADVPNETCDMDKWVKARGRKVVAVMYTTVQPPWMDVVPLPFSFVCGCVGEGVIKSWNHHIPGST